MKRFVLDSSVTMAWCFEDEKNAYTDEFLDALSDGSHAVVPSLWFYEVLNVLVVAQRRRRMTQAQAIHFWRELEALPIEIGEDRPGHASLEILALAEQHRLTAYDAAYLELALRQGLPLATIDEPLKKAAKATGVPISRP